MEAIMSKMGTNIPTIFKSGLLTACCEVRFYRLFCSTVLEIACSNSVGHD